MSRIFIDGFEMESSDNLELWSTVSSTVTIVDASPVGLTGNKCVKIDYDASPTVIGALTKVLGVGTVYYLGFNVVTPVYDHDFSVKFISSSGTGWCTLKILYNEFNVTFEIYDVNNALEDSYVYATLTPTDVFNIQIKCSYVVSNEVTMQVKLDDVTILTASNMDFGSSAYDVYLFSFIKSTNENLYVCIDDIVVDDSEWPGPSRIYAMYPYDEGATSQWLSTDSTNFTSINDIEVNESTYIYSETFNHIELFKVLPISESGVTIKSLSIPTFSMRVAGPPPTQSIRAIVRTDSTNFYGENETIGAPGASFGGNLSIFEVNPSSREAWEEADLSGLEIGVILVDS